MSGRDEPETRAFGGESVDEFRYPYFVLLYGGGTLCGGFLITSNIFVTAAHCDNSSDRIARVGASFNVHMANDDENVEYLSIEEEVPHPLWKGGDGISSNEDLSHDVMVVKLRSPSSHKPAMLDPGDDPSIPSSPLTALGFGDTSAGNESVDFPDRLMEVQVDLLDQNVCKSRYQKGFVTDDMLCTLGDDGKGPCGGDSGGPLISKGSGPLDDVVVGIISWGNVCGAELAPTVYAKISYFYPWIVETACRLSPGGASRHFNCEQTNSPSAAPSAIPPSAAPSTIPPSATPSTLPPSASPPVTVEPKGSFLQSPVVASLVAACVILLLLVLLQDGMLRRKRRRRRVREAGARRREAESASKKPNPAADDALKMSFDEERNAVVVNDVLGEREFEIVLSEGQERH